MVYIENISRVENYTIQKDFADLSDDIDALMAKIPPSVDNSMILKLVGIKNHIGSLLDPVTTRDSSHVENLRDIIRKTRQTLIETGNVYTHITSLHHNQETIPDTTRQVSSSHERESGFQSGLILFGVILAFLLCMVIIFMVFMKGTPIPKYIHTITQKCIDNICTVTSQLGLG
jgi:hypothetical protein